MIAHIGVVRVWSVCGFFGLYNVRRLIDTDP